MSEFRHSDDCPGRALNCDSHTPHTVCAIFNDGYQAGLAQAEKLVAKEREAVVAWLRNEPSLSMEGDFPLNANWALGKAANTVERAEHINASGAGVEGDGK